LTLRSKVKVKQRSLRYATHHLMVMHPHTKYNWPIWKDKKVMVRTSFAEKKKRKQNKKLDWNDMSPFVRRGDITRKNCFRYLKLMSPLNAAICYLTLRSKSHEGHYGMRHHLMVMHPHTKYNWPIWKDKTVMVRTSFAKKKQKKKLD
jgi:acyl-CoA thioesterase FadM